MARVTLLCGCSDVYEHQHLFGWGVNWNDRRHRDTKCYEALTLDRVS